MDPKDQQLAPKKNSNNSTGKPKAKPIKPKSKSNDSSDFKEEVIPITEPKIETQEDPPITTQNAMVYEPPPGYMKPRQSRNSDKSTSNKKSTDNGQDSDQPTMPEIKIETQPEIRTSQDEDARYSIDSDLEQELINSGRRQNSGSSKKSYDDDLNAKVKNKKPTAPEIEIDPEIRTSQDKDYQRNSTGSKSQPPPEFVSCQCGIRNGSVNQGEIHHDPKCQQRMYKECNTNKIINNPTEQVKKPKPGPKINVQNYLANSDCECDMNNIIIGQRGRDQVKAVGQELLMMGKRVLNEMGFVENRSIEDGQASTSARGAGSMPDPQCTFQRGCQCCECQGQQPTVYRAESAQTDDCAPNLQSCEDWICDIEKSKREFIQAFDKICHSISQAEARRHSYRSESRISQSISEGGEKGLTDGSNNTVNSQQFQQLKNGLSQLESKFHDLDDQLGELIETVLKQNRGMTNKISTMEDDILHMAKLIHELQCVTRLQMHLGDQNGQ